MGLIINPRGAAGSGKTELARRLLNRYGWKPGIYASGRGSARPFFRKGRDRPRAYRLAHPYGRRPLAVLGHYEVTSGGCDTIRASDGGLAEAVRLAHEFASSGFDVLLEGLKLSSDVDHSILLARSHRLCVLHLATPPVQCARNLAKRRRKSSKQLTMLTGEAARQQQRIAVACDVLRPKAHVEVLAFDEALRRAEALLELGESGLAGRIAARD